MEKNEPNIPKWIRDMSDQELKDHTAKYRENEPHYIKFSNDDISIYDLMWYELQNRGFVYYMDEWQKLKCSLCDEPITDIETLFFGGQGSELEDQPVCEMCYSDSGYEPQATVFYNGERNHGCIITPVENWTYDDPTGRADPWATFKVSWHSSDAWRGYYEPVCTSGNASFLCQESLLWGHESQEMIKNLFERFIEEMHNHSIKWATVVCRSSNVFYQSAEIWVESSPEHMLTAMLILSKIRTEIDYNNPIYHTGILIGRDTLQKMQNLGFKVQTDSDVEQLFRERPHEILKEVQDKIKAQSSELGDSNA